MRRSSHGGSFLGLLFVVFLVLKLTGVIDWSWWWVTSPLWLPVVLVLGGLLLAAVLGLTAYKVVMSTVRRRGPGSGAERSPGGAPTGGNAQIVVEAVGSEVVEPPTATAEKAGIPSAGSAGTTTSSESGPERH